MPPRFPGFLRFAGSSKPPVPRGIRVINVLSLVLFLAGAGLYTRAWLGMRDLRTYETAPDAEPFAGMALFEQYLQMSRAGVWLVMAAVAVAVIAAVATWVLRRRVEEPGGEPTDLRA